MTRATRSSLVIDYVVYEPGRQSHCCSGPEAGSGCASPPARKPEDGEACICCGAPATRRARPTRRGGRGSA
eukprot:CAMPEP_0195111800 /NCGR_PEP_ID=MMETSP0448-20130528/97214_1 /TAXON_ID=66468 /ORGANISM="Heterocapsa triquestra, Strain CCMP 448" /LENGTH=70 /DNA_ID=CAMNT_0040148603 /DNA_START=15 /DNA_END=223 /DNA_ORIENTATION=-